MERRQENLHKRSSEKRRLIKAKLRHDTCFNCFYYGGFGRVDDGHPWWCYGGQHQGMERTERPEELKCDQFKQWQAVEDMGL